MEIYVLNAGYEMVGMIDEAESITWIKNYYDIGECEIYLPCNLEIVSLLHIGNYLFRYDDDMFCRIENVRIETDAEEGDYIRATATDIGKILSGRIVRYPITFSGKVCDFLAKVITDNCITTSPSQRGISNMTIDKSNFSSLTATIETTVHTDDILQLVISTCKNAGYGFRISYDISTGKLVFSLYAGKDKSDPSGDEYVEFSPEFANILSSEYEADESTYKNVAYVGYKDSSDNLELKSVYIGNTEPKGEYRREIYVDGTGLSRSITYDELKEIFTTVQRSPATMGQETDGYYYIAGNIKVATFEVTTSGEEKTEKITTTDFTHLKLIGELGKNKLYERVKSETFGGEVDTVNTYEFGNGKDYYLGDIVQVVNEYGISAPAMITGVQEVEDLDEGHTFTPTFEYFN